MKVEPNRLHFLDSLRGMAALSVIMGHFFLAFKIGPLIPYINYSPLHIFYDGSAAVAFFFVLSGYVLTLSLKNQKEVHLLTFYLKRVFRIWPAYAFVVLLSFFCWKFYHHINIQPQYTNWLESSWLPQFSSRGLLQQLLFIQPSSGPVLVPINWTLTIEMQISFIIPFLALICKQTSKLSFFILNIVLIVIFRLPPYLVSFSLGVFLAIYQAEILSRFTALKEKRKWLIIIVTIVLYTWRYTIPHYFPVINPERNYLESEYLVQPLVGLGGLLILIYALTSANFQKILNLRVLTFIGRISYSVYLCHMLVLIFLIPKAFKYLTDGG